MSFETENPNFSKCAWCHGGGRWQVAPGHLASCIVCGGKGRVTAGQTPVKCRQCEGTGRTNTVSPCLSCSGTGWESYLYKTQR